MSPKRFPASVRLVLTLAFWLLLWQLAAQAVSTELLLPSPLAVGEALLRLSTTPAFWSSAGASLLRILLGLLLGTLSGTILALLTCGVGWLDLLLSPAIRVVRATPVASFILLVLLWTSRTAVPVVIAALMVLPVVWGAVCQGVAQTDPLLLELSRAYRFGRWKTLRLVYFPSVLPYFSSGLRTAMGLAWKSGVAAEVICHPKAAVGTEISNAKLTLETPELFAWTAVVILLSFGLERLAACLLRLLERKGDRKP